MEAITSPPPARRAAACHLPPIVSFSNDPWHSAVTGRQHVLGRLARTNRVVFVNPLHNLRAKNGWSRPSRWRQQLSQDASGVRVLHWPVWLGQCFRPGIERPLQEERKRRLHRLIRSTAGDAASSAGPILYVWHPDEWPLVKDLPSRLVVYHVYDHYELLSPVHADRVAAQQEQLAARADLIICVSRRLAERFGGPSDRVRVIPNGADIPHFAQSDLPEPPEIADLPRPRMALVARLNGNYSYGLIHDLLERHRLPLVIVGPRRGMPEDVSGELDRLLRHPLVRWVGEQPFERLPEFVAHCDFGLIPYRPGTSSDFASPLKLFEYLAAGKGVIAADVEAVRPYRQDVALAGTFEEWSVAIEDMVHSHDERRIARRRQLARENSWDSRVAHIESILFESLDAAGRQRSAA